MATNIGEATIKLSFDNKSLEASQKQAEQSMNSWTNKLGSIAKTGGKIIASGLAVASTAVAGLAAASVKGYAEYEQLVGGIETLFKDSSDEMMAYAAQSYKTAQISAAEYMSTATSFSASLIQGLKGDTAKAAAYANRAIISMSDNANKMGTDMALIQSAYQGFAKQNYTMLDNLKLGYGGTLTEMQRLIADASKMKDEMNKLGVTVDANSTSFDNIVNAIAVVQEHLGIAGTSAEEAGRTIQGSFSSMKAAAQDLITGLTDPNADLGQLIDNLITSIVGDGTDKNLGVLGNIQPAIKRAMEGIGKLIEKGVPQLIEMIPALIADTLPSVLQSGVNLFGRIFDYLPQLAQTLINLIAQLAQQIIPRLPQLLLGIVNGILGVIKTLTSTENQRMILDVGLQLLLGLVQAIPQIVIALVEALPDIIAGIVGYLTDPNSLMLIIQAGVELFMGLVKAVPQILGALITAFAELFRKLWEQVKKNFTDFAANFGESIASVFKKAINGVLQFIENFINGPIDLINGFIQKINDNFGAIGVNIGKISRVSLPRLAQGGIATSATTAIIGEAGREAVIPLERNTDNWAGLLSRTLANEFKDQGLSTEQGITIYMTNEINNELDADEIGRRLLTSIRRAA